MSTKRATDVILDAGTLAGAAELQVRAPREGDSQDMIRFNMELAWESNRDQWGRPKVKKPSGGSWGYRRASSFGSPNENTRLLDNWKLRKVAEGFTLKAPLRLEYSRLLPRLASPDDAIVKAAKKRMDELCEEAMKAAGAEDAASVGTSLHDVLEFDDLGRDTGFVPDEWLPDLAAYRRMRTCFVTLSSELIVVNHEFQIGGKYDRCVELVYPMTTDTGVVLPAGTVIIGDVKTSQSMDFAGCKFGQQVWTYANSCPYNPITESDYDWPHEPPRTDWAVIMHVPSGKGLAQLYWVDLKHYKPAMRDTIRVYEWRNKWGKKGINPGRTFEDYTLTAKHAKTVDDLHAAYCRAAAAGEWDEDVRELFSARREVLELAS